MINKIKTTSAPFQTIEEKLEVLRNKINEIIDELKVLEESKK